MSTRWCMYELTVVGSLVGGSLAGCTRAMDDHGGAPLVDTTELYLDQRVTVIGEVDEVRGEQTFTLKNNNLTAADEPLLVITEQPARQITLGGATVFRGEWLKVYGMVRRLRVPEIERAYGFDLDPAWAVAYDNRPVVVTRWISQPQMSQSGATPERADVSARDAVDRLAVFGVGSTAALPAGWVLASRTGSTPECRNGWQLAAPCW